MGLGDALSGILSVSGCGEPEDPVQHCSDYRIALYWTYQDTVSGSDVDHLYWRSNSVQRQYINLDTEAGHREHGRRLRFKARSICVQGNVPVPDTEVRWSVEREPGNRSSLQGEMRGGINQNRDDQITARTDAQGYTEVELYVSQYGGDRFRLWARSGTGERVTDWFECWRKLWCETDYMVRPQGGHFGQYGGANFQLSIIQDVFNRNRNNLFLELEATGSDSSPRYDRVVTLAEMDRLALRVRSSPSGGRRYFHLIFVNTLGAATFTDRYPTTFRMSRSRLSTTLSQIDADVLIEEDDWFVSATVQEHGHPAVTLSPARSQGHDLTQMFRLSLSGQTYTLDINLTSLGLSHSRPVRVDLDTKLWRSASGRVVFQGTRAAAFVATGAVELIVSQLGLTGRIGDAVASVTIHEIGHLMGLASDELPDGNPCSETYQHEGSHCHGDSDTCVMFESQSPDHLNFCSDCRDVLLGRDLSSLPIQHDTPWR